MRMEHGTWNMGHAAWGMGHVAWAKRKRVLWLAFNKNSSLDTAAKNKFLRSY